MSHNPDLITLRNGQYNKSRRSRAVKRLYTQTLIKVGGGSNPNFYFKLDFFSFDVMARRHHIVKAQMPKRSFEIPMTFASGRRKTGIRYH